MAAYLEVIENAKEFIYIENQYFVTALKKPHSGVRNRVGQALVERIIKAHKNQENFKVYVILPLLADGPIDIYNLKKAKDSCTKLEGENN